MTAVRIIYRNLSAEMARNHETITSIAKKTGINKDTLSRKLNGEAPFKLEEAVQLQQVVFPDHDIAYLFAEAFQK